MKPKRYVKKPVEVEAMQVTEDTPESVLKEFCPSFLSPAVGIVTYFSAAHFTIQSREGHVGGRLNDWILKNSRGWFWINAEDTFAENYEEVDVNSPP